jgi:hypothetical protein
MNGHSFGINMKQWCRSHELEVKTALEEKKVTLAMLEEHREKIAWLQHERLVHLIVTVMVVLGEVFVVNLVLLHADLVGIAGAAFMLGLAILLGFYFYHYFFLENTVQRWYLIAGEMERYLASPQ